MDDRTETRQETTQSCPHLFVIVDYYNLNVVKPWKQNTPFQRLALFGALLQRLPLKVRLNASAYRVLLLHFGTKVTKCIAARCVNRVWPPIETMAAKDRSSSLPTGSHRLKIYRDLENDKISNFRVTVKVTLFKNWFFGRALYGLAVFKSHFSFYAAFFRRDDPLEKIERRHMLALLKHLRF